MVRQLLVVIGIGCLSALGTAAPANAGFLGCAGDCDGGGTVVIAEIIRSVNIALGNVTVDTCTNADRNSNEGIEINELVSAVNSALNGCPDLPPTPTSPGETETPVANTATPTPTTPTGGSPSPTPTQTSDVTPIPGVRGASVAGTMTALVNTIGLLSETVTAIINAISLTGGFLVQDAALGGVGGGPAECPLGGTATQTGTFPVNYAFMLTACRVPTADGSVVFDGSLTGMFLNFNLSLQMRFLDMDGNETRTGSVQLAGMIAPTLEGDCGVTGVTLLLSSGMLSVTRTGGEPNAISFSQTRIEIEDIAFDDECVPQTFQLTFNGGATLQAANGDPVSVTFTEFVVGVNATGNPATFQIAGNIDSACFGGATTISTVTPLAVSRGEVCPRAGELLATIATNAVRIFYRDTQAIEVDDGDNGSIDLSAPNCLDPRLLMCLG
jgi:hypothetical protein